MPVSRPDIAVDFKTVTLAISLMPCRAHAAFGPASEGSRAVTHSLFKFVPHHEHDASKFVPKITKCLDFKTAQHLQCFVLTVQNGGAAVNGQRIKRNSLPRTLKYHRQDLKCDPNMEIIMARRPYDNRRRFCLLQTKLK